jgi:ATP:ADP antiporter, AAA family
MNVLRVLGLEAAPPAERRAAFLVAVMFACALAATFVLRPLRDQFGVEQGVDRLPWLYTLTLAATVLAVPPFWWLANRMPSARFVPRVLAVCIAALLLLASGLAAIGDYDWVAAPWLGQVFWGGYSALNVVVPALVWIHAVEHFSQRAAQRVFGLVAVGGTVGAVAGSWLAGALSRAHWPPAIAAVVAALLLGLALFVHRRSLPSCRALLATDSRAPAAVARGGMFAGLRIVLRDPQARAIGVYMMLLGVLATAFYAAQTELVGQGVDGGRAQHGWLADVETCGQGLVLLLQVFCTGRLLRRAPAFVLLASLPFVSLLGLGAWWVWPTAAAIFAVQVLRRGAQFALEKPAREVLYTPLDLETKHKVKFLLDTFAFRLGDLLGALLQVVMRDLAFGMSAIVGTTALVAVLWGLLAWSIDRRQRAATS